MDHEQPNVSMPPPSPSSPPRWDGDGNELVPAGQRDGSKNFRLAIAIAIPFVVLLGIMVAYGIASQHPEINSADVVTSPESVPPPPTGGMWEGAWRIAVFSCDECAVLYATDYSPPDLPTSFRYWYDPALDSTGDGWSSFRLLALPYCSLPSAPPTSVIDSACAPA